MLFDLGQRLHRLIYGSMYASDRKQAQYLYGRVGSLLRQHGVASEAGREQLIEKIALSVAAHLRLEPDRIEALVDFVTALLNYEGLFLTPDIDFSEERTVSEYWRLREELGQDKRLLEHFPAVVDAITDFVLKTFAALKAGSAATTKRTEDADAIHVAVRRIDSIDGLATVVEAMAAAAFSEEVAALGLFPRLRRRLDANLVVASGGNPNDIDSFTKAYRWPTKYDAKTPDDLVTAYLSGLPLFDLFAGEEVFTIPLATRFEHHHIIAGSGHGKTQTLQYLISQDLEAVARGDRSLVVIDSQGDLIRTIAGLKQFAPGEPLHDRICIIDPTDIEWPVSLNLFDVGQDRLNSYPLLERERLTNSILELYDFVLGTLLSAEMTQKQNVIFRYVTRLMLHIPNATIHTLRDLMEKGSEVRFVEHIAKLEGTARHFFETEFPSKEFAQTRQQVLRRLWGILENQTFERMFSHPHSKFDLFAEMNAGKVILINTAKDLLKETGTEIFGRFFIAMIAQAAQERAVLPDSKRMPTMVYIDEAADYFDRNIGIILSQARKYKVGMVLAHQYLGQLEGKLQDAFSANTAIKFAGGFTGRDARQAAQMLSCDPALIEDQPKGSYAALVRGVTRSAIPLRFPFGVLEDLPQMSSEEREALKCIMRQKYAVHYHELAAYRDIAGRAKETESFEAATPPSGTTSKPSTHWEEASKPMQNKIPEPKDKKPPTPGDIDTPPTDW